jgi:hypothetical protein
MRLDQFLLLVTHLFSPWGWCECRHGAALVGVKPEINLQANRAVYIGIVIPNCNSKLKNACRSAFRMRLLFRTDKQVA